MAAVAGVVITSVAGVATGATPPNLSSLFVLPPSTGLFIGAAAFGAAPDLFLSRLGDASEKLKSGIASTEQAPVHHRNDGPRASGAGNGLWRGAQRRGMEGMVDPGEQYGLREGFLEQQDSLLERSVLTQDGFGVTRHVKNPNAGPRRGAANTELITLPAGHHHVGQEEVDGARMVPRRLERVMSAGRRAHFVSVLSKDPLSDLSKILGIFDHQDRSRFLSLRCNHSDAGSCWCHIGSRQQDVNTRTDS